MQKGQYYIFKLNKEYGNIYNGNIKSTPSFNGRIIYTLTPDQHIQIIKIIDNIWCCIEYYNHYKKTYNTGYIMYKIANIEEFNNYNILYVMHKIINITECNNYNAFESSLIYIDNPYFQVLEKFGLDYYHFQSLSSSDFSNIISIPCEK
jgi:hypothetical protein